ncbi:hypothetical protein C2S51_033146 [Perilla frutescens var. frutescens]|nr:hypothetical protein C2S51_033146 [Perilla frutescens var. frutescens]
MRGSSSNEKLDINASLESELEALLLQQQRNRGLVVERERSLDINRSGSAPPTVEGALLAAGSLLRYPNFVKLDGSGSSVDNSVSIGVLTEEEIRSHPAYLEYYYSHENFNPRLPPPMLSKEDWRVAQRVRAAGHGLGRNVMDNGGGLMLYPMPVGVPVKKSEDELIELRKAAIRNLSRKNSAESLDKGMMGASSSGMGVRRKSFADILQEGCGQPPKSHLSRPASQNSVADVADSVPNSSAAERQNKAESFGALHHEKTFTGLSNTQNFGSANPSSLASCVSSTLTSNRNEMAGRPPAPASVPALIALSNGVHLVDNLNSATLIPSSGIFEIADIASSLSVLNMARGQLPTESISQSSHQKGIPSGQQQQHYSDNTRLENAGNNNYVNLARSNGLTRGPSISKPPMNERVGFPRRTSSTTNLQSQHSLSDFARMEDLKNQLQSNHFPGVNLSTQRNGAYAVEQKPDTIIGSLLAGGNGDGQILRPSYPPGFHVPVMDPHQVQYIQKMSNHGKDSTRIAGNSSQGLHFVGSRGHDNSQSLEKAYLEALLLQQAQQYQSHILQKPGGVNHQYHGNPAFGPYVASFQGNPMLSSQNPRDSSRTFMTQNEKCAQMSPNLESLKGETTGSLHPQSGNNTKGRFESLLEMLKSNKTKSLELSDILGHVVEFSTDQFGSRFIQQKLETATVEEKTKILAEIIPNALGLMIDVFGNYVIQKFFEHGTESHRKELARHLIGHVLPLTLQMYGCRVIQKALEVVDEDMRAKMAAELDGSVMKCIHDQNGNHVIQKCIESIPEDRIQFIISSFVGQVLTLSTHPYGCRVIQRALEHCDDPKTQQKIMDEVMSSVCKLAQDQYGNYVIQHVVEHGKPHERAMIISKLAGQIVKMSQQKFASNVVEKCLTFGGPEERKILVNEILGSTEENEPLQAMMKDPFGNYVVQKVLETCDDKSRELILSRIKVHLSALKRYTYGKHIVSRVEKLVAAGERHIGQSSSKQSN